MKKLIIGLVAIVVLLVVAVVAIPFFIPLDTIKAELIAQAKQATGRDVRIDGDFKLSIFPNAEFVAGKVSVGNAKGGKAANMASIDRVSVSVALIPLISGNVDVNSFVIDKPVINLEIDKNGKPNWEFAAAGGGDSKPAAAESKGADSSGGSPLAGITLDDVRLVDGTITYSDATSGATHRLDAINWKVALPSLTDPVAVNGDFVWNKEKIDIALTLATPDTLLNAKKTKIDTSISASLVKLDFKGSATNAKSLSAGGAVTLDVPSIRKLAAWVGSPIDAPGSGYGPLKITGTVAVDGSKYAFKQAKLAVDEIEGSGDFAFDGGGKVPAVSAILKLGMLDLNPYLPPEEKGADKPAASASSSGGGASKPADWSDDPIDMSGLKAANANLDLTVAGILVRKIKVGESNLKVTLKNGVLVTDLTKLALYKGSGTAKITANASGSKPKIGVNFDLKGFDANPFLKDAAGFERLEGTANADIAITTSGMTERQLVSALNGKGKVQFLDGAIVGINLAAMLRNVTTAFMNKDSGETQKTDFAELKGTYTIKNGLVTNNDLSLKSPFIRVTGKGTSDLPKRTVNYRVTPKAVATTKGQGGSSDSGGIKVPVDITGPWDDLSYKPDLTAILGDIAKDPTKALEAVKKIVPGVPKLGGSSGGSILPKLGGSDSGGGTAVPKAEEAVKGLKKLFGN